MSEYDPHREVVAEGTGTMVRVSPSTRWLRFASKPCLQWTAGVPAVGGGGPPDTQVEPSGLLGTGDEGQGQADHYHGHPESHVARRRRHHTAAEQEETDPIEVGPGLGPSWC